MPPVATLIRVLGPVCADSERVLTDGALRFVTELQKRFGARREGLLARRIVRQRQIAEGAGFLPETQHIRDDPGWRVAAIPPALQDRRVEITGPVDRKMMINALNSGAQVFMADFEDSHSPTWAGTLAGQANIMDAVRGQLTLDANGKHYEVGPDPATLLVRVRGWHLDEAHAKVHGKPVSASLFDFGMTVYHNAVIQVASGNGPWFYLPKIESHLEARLWAEVFRFAEDTLHLPRGTIKATVLIETLPAAFEMEEILYELKDHIVGLNAGRWDYLFSCIKTFADDAERVFPDRSHLTMGAPFMRAYARLLVATCHRRGAFALGGMSAFIPNRRRPDVTERALAAVRKDKEREVADGCDGTWVAHPDLVPVAQEIFSRLDGTSQLGRIPKGEITGADLLDFRVEGAATMAGVETNVEVTLRYLTGWLDGIGAVAIHDLMEDAATAEISRSQLWQWRHHGTEVDGRPVTAALLRRCIDIHAARLATQYPEARVQTAATLLRDAVLAESFPPFLTVPAYQRLVEDP